MSDSRIANGLARQLDARAALLGAGAIPLGWKVGLNAPAVQEALGIEGTVVGSMTSASLLESGAEFDLADTNAVAVEAELALHIGSGGSIAGYGAAIEIVDIDLPFEDLERILEENVFHRAVLLTDPTPTRPAGLTLRVSRNGSVEHELDGSADLERAETTVARVAELLGAAGGSLTPGEVIIAGSIAPLLFVSAGDQVRVELEPLGSLDVGFSP